MAEGHQRTYWDGGNVLDLEWRYRYIGRTQSSKPIKQYDGGDIFSYINYALIQLILKERNFQKTEATLNIRR